MSKTLNQLSSGDAPEADVLSTWCIIQEKKKVKKKKKVLHKISSLLKPLYLHRDWTNTDQSEHGSFSKKKFFFLIPKRWLDKHAPITARIFGFAILYLATLERQVRGQVCSQCQVLFVLSSIQISIYTYLISYNCTVHHEASYTHTHIHTRYLANLPQTHGTERVREKDATHTHTHVLTRLER